jgi:DNA polymerase-3 subunit epsilon
VRTLVIDTETSGIPARGELVTSPSYPHLVQLAGLLIEDGVERASFDLTVYPESWEIPAEAAAVHGVDQDLARSVGVPLRLAVAAFTNFARRADEVAGHNLEFDLGVLRAAMHRVGAPPLPLPPAVCTADLGVDVAKLPATERMIAYGRGAQHKRPKLSELYEHLFGETFEDAHSAIADCRACARCLLELRRRAHGS